MNSKFSKNKIALHVGIALTASALFVGCAGNSAKKTEQAEMQQSKPVETVSVEQKQDVAPMTEVSKQEAEVSKVEHQESNTEETNPAAPVIAYPEIDIAEVTKPEKSSFRFGFDKSELSDDDKDVVKQHAKYLISNPEAIMKIKGHTDHHGPKVYNEFLSKKRANSIAKILIEEGVAESQLEISALANDEPLQDVTDTRKNRRVELNYIEMNMATNN